MIDLITWLWKPPAGYRSEFKAEHVNALGRMLNRHMRASYRFSCITDIPSGIDSSIRTIPLWPSPPIEVSPGRPNCFRRLRMFSPEMNDVIGPRFVSLDLDCVVLQDLMPLFDRSDDFVMWGDTAKNTHYNGSLVMMTAGARAKVWTSFDPDKAKAAIRSGRVVGSDQAWISIVLGPNEKRFGAKDGVFSFRNDVLRHNLREAPNGARIVFFHGREDPWSPRPQTYRWIKENWG